MSPPEFLLDVVVQKNATIVKQLSVQSKFNLGLDILD